jgi:hypothetical protein
MKTILYILIITVSLLLLFELLTQPQIMRNENTQPDPAISTSSLSQVQAEPQEDVDEPEAEDVVTDNLDEQNIRTVLSAPKDGMYFGAFADFGPNEKNVTRRKIKNFEALTGRKISWAYFSQNWFDGIIFPQQTVALLADMNITPYIRLMPRSNFSSSSTAQRFTLDRIISGEFDSELRRWAMAAASAETPLIIEFGTEVNGDWFPWNGAHNGAGTDNEYGSSTQPDGPERFIDARRRVINIFREADASNVTWVYHVNAISSPSASWNQVMSYYPGDDYIDWIGVSVYGAQTKKARWVSFYQVFSSAYATVTERTDKPIAIVEVGVSEGSDKNMKAQWFEDMFSSLTTGQYPEVKALAYWHSHFTTADGLTANLFINSSPSAQAAFKKYIADPIFLSDTIFIQVAG